MMQNIKSKKDYYWLHIAVFLALCFLFGYVPPIGSLTPEGMRIVGVFLALLYGWNFIDLFMTSLVALVALGFTDYAGTVTKAIVTAFSNSTVMLSLLVLPLMFVAEISGLSTKIGMWIVSRKFIAGKPWVFITVILLGTYFADLFVAGVALTFLLWSVLYGTFLKIGYKPGDALPAYVCAGIAFVGVYSYSALPWKTVPLVVIGSLDSISNGAFTLDYLQFILVSVPMYAIVTIGYVLLLRFVLKPDVSKLKNIDEAILEEYRKDLKLNRFQKWNAAILILFIIMILFPEIFDKVGIVGLMAKFGTVGSGALGLMILCILRGENKKPLIDYKEVFAKGVKWDVIMMLAVAIYVGNALASDGAGFVLTLNNLISALSIDNMFIFLIIFLVCCILITQVAHNVTVVVIAIPILYPLCVESGINPLAVAILCNYVSGIAFATPAASALAAIAFANSEWIGPKYAYKSGIGFTVVGAILLLLAIPLASIVCGGLYL